MIKTVTGDERDVMSGVTCDEVVGKVREVNVSRFMGMPELGREGKRCQGRVLPRGGC